MPARYSVLLIAAGLLLSACQPRPATRSLADLTPPDPEPDAVSPMATVPAVLPDAFAGRWFVSAVYPAGTSRASMGDQHLGVSLVIGAEEASDVNGQRCLGPAIGLEQGRQDLALGGMRLTGAEKLTVTCKGKVFATYLLLPGTRLDASYQAAAELPNALINERPEARYLLERADHVLLRQASLPAAPAEVGKAISAPSAPVTQPAKPVAPAIPAPAPALSAPLVLAPALPEPATPVPAVVAPAAATEGASLPAPGAAIHLASYNGITAAKRGWKILLGDFDALDPLSPLYVTVDVPQKGPMVRLYATGGDAASLGRACTALRARGAYCELSR